MTSGSDGGSGDGEPKWMKALVEAGTAAIERSRADRAAGIGGRDGRICACGHPVSRHYESVVTRDHVCRPTRMECPCRDLLPVLVTSDTRQFLWKTEGAGAGQHALSRGLAAARVKGAVVELLEAGSTCRSCGAEEVSLRPVAVAGTDIMKLSGKPEKRNGLLCEDCVRKLGGGSAGSASSAGSGTNGAGE